LKRIDLLARRLKKLERAAGVVPVQDEDDD
jgi:hypothetical protein